MSQDPQHAQGFQTCRQPGSTSQQVSPFPQIPPSHAVSPPHKPSVTLSLPPGATLEPNPTPRKRRQSTGNTVTDLFSYQEGGRTYQGYRPEAYQLPNDGEEQLRYDMQHHVLLIMLDRRLAAAPIIQPEHVLDIGTGTGIWALQFALQNPKTHVIGTDLSAIQPPTTLPNVEFWVEDSENAEWIFPNLFDYIHIRYMGFCFDDFMTVVQKSYKHMSPGGWIELVDATREVQSPDNTAQGTALERFFQLLVIGAANLNRDLIKARYFKEYLTCAGFVDVTEEVYPLPLSPWPKDERLCAMGQFVAEGTFFAIESYRKILLAAGLAEEEIGDFAERVRRDLQDPGIHAYLHMYYVYGRKPYNWEVASIRSQMATGA